MSFQSPCFDEPLAASPGNVFDEECRDSHAPPRSRPRLIFILLGRVHVIEPQQIIATFYGHVGEGALIVSISRGTSKVPSVAISLPRFSH